MARILIVEDEDRIASFVSKGLAADGHRTTVAVDGRVGLDHALSGDFDLMVLDIGLPGMGGFEVLDQLRSQGSKLPVIVLTARDSVTDTVSALEGGADDYMPKPFRFAELLARIRLRLRAANENGGAPRNDVLEAGGVRLDVRTRRATVGERELELSARQLHRRCETSFGYGLKMLARIGRFERALALARSGLPLARVAADAGYADQPHLSRDVRALAGVPATTLLAEAGQRPGQPSAAVSSGQNRSTELPSGSLSTA